MPQCHSSAADKNKNKSKKKVTLTGFFEASSSTEGQSSSASSSQASSSSHPPSRSSCSSPDESFSPPPPKKLLLSPKRNYQHKQLKQSLVTVLDPQIYHGQVPQTPLDEWAVGSAYTFVHTGANKNISNTAAVEQQKTSYVCSGFERSSGETIQFKGHC